MTLVKLSTEHYSFTPETVCKCKRETDMQWCDACIKQMQLNQYTPHIFNKINKEQAMTECKELIKPEDYNKLNHGDAVEVVTRAIFGKVCREGFETTDNVYSECTSTSDLYRANDIPIDWDATFS